MILLPVAEALATMLDSVDVSSREETLPLSEADGRVLAQDIFAPRSQPPFPASAMDGYAVRSADLPGHLRLIGESAAGHPFSDTVQPGECCRIFTGAVVPPGADAILIQEDAVVEGMSIRSKESVPAGHYVRPAGLDFTEGDTLLAAGDRIHPAALSLIAATGLASVSVRARPHVGIVMSGDELRWPGTLLGPADIYASNGIGVAAIVTRAGGKAVDFGIVRDDESSIAELLDRIERTGVDILVTLGGASVGDHDLIGPALERHGVRLDFMKLAMRPGKPVMFGMKDETAFLGLPGNPVSSLVGAKILLEPLVKRMLGNAPGEAPETGRLAVDLPANGNRTHYMRARLSEAGLTPFGNQDSSLLSTLARADVLLVRPAGDKARKAGEKAEFLRL